jgi:hypothetical protein
MVSPRFANRAAAMQPNRSQHPRRYSVRKGDSSSRCAQGRPMTNELIEQSRKRSAFADQAFVATTLALVVSIAVAFTVVSIEIARAAM